MKMQMFNKSGQNVFLYFDEATKEGVIIDAGCNEDDMKDLTAAINADGVKVAAVLLTHTHFDHIPAIDDIKKATGAKVYCHKAEREWLANPELNLSTMINKEIRMAADEVFEGGETVNVGGAALKVIHTPGHTPGGLCFYDQANGVLFSGDTLFFESIGRTDIPFGDQDAIVGAIKEKLFTLPGNTKVYSGHGAETTIEHEIKAGAVK